MTENRTVWKSDNQGDKEETFIQTGRRGRHGQLDREDSRQGSGGGGRLWNERGWKCCSYQTPRPHIRAQINREERRGSEADHPTQGSSSGI